MGSTGERLNQTFVARAAAPSVLRDPRALAWKVALREANRIGYTDVEEFASVALVGIAKAVATFKPGLGCGTDPLLMHAMVKATSEIRSFTRAERRLKRCPVELVSIADQSFTDGGKSVRATENRIEVEELLSILDEEKRFAAVLIGLVGHTFDDAGEIMGVTGAGAHVRYSAAVRHMRAHAEFDGRKAEWSTS